MVGVTTTVFVGINEVMVDAQPVAVFVTTQVYVPAEPTVVVADVGLVILPGPVQLKDTGVEVVVAATCAVNVLQVIDPVLELVTAGNPLLETTVTDPVLVQPFAGFVIVNTNVPVAQAVVVNELVEPQTPAQLGVQVLGVDAPEMETEGLAQVIVCVGDTVKVGTTVF